MSVSGSIFSPYGMPELGGLQPVLVGGLGLEEAAHEGEVEPDRRLQLLRRVVRVGQQLQHARPRLLQVAQNLQINNHKLVLHRSGGFADSAETEYYAFQIP